MSASSFKMRLKPMEFLVPKVSIEKVIAALENDNEGSINKSIKDDTPKTWRSAEADKILREVDAAKAEYDVIYDKLGRDLFEKIGFRIRVTDSLSWAARKISGGQFITRAWLKFYEIYCHFNIVSYLLENDGHIFAFLNAELPGASICALNHYIKTMKPKANFDWRGSSYVSQWLSEEKEKYEHEKASVSLEDKYGIWEMNPDKWLMERDVNNGDATDISNLLNFRQKLCPEALCRANLYSHDAGIDVSSESAAEKEMFGRAFENQEARNTRVHIGCGAAGLLTLAKGGVFIAKQYSILERINIDLLIIYAALFDKFYLFKPITSGVSNSEIYLVGIGYCGEFPEAIKAAIFGRLEKMSFRPLLSHKGAEIAAAVTKIIEFEKIYGYEQIEFIKQDIKYYKLGKVDAAEFKEIEPLKYKFNNQYFADNKLMKIDPKDEIKARPINKKK